MSDRVCGRADRHAIGVVGPVGLRGPSCTTLVVVAKAGYRQPSASSNSDSCASECVAPTHDDPHPRGPRGEQFRVQDHRYGEAVGEPGRHASPNPNERPAIVFSDR